MRVGWLSDIHLNFLDYEGVSEFISGLASADVDLWAVSGDIGEADSVLDYLDRLASGLGRPVYFVLGNHDYYGSSISDVTERVNRATREGEMQWLNSSSPVDLNCPFAIVGDDGWGDGRSGDPRGSRVDLSDFYLIEELTELPRTDLIAKVKELGDACASRLAPKLEKAAERNGRVCIVTHVPPFEGAAWYDGKQSGPEWLPGSPARRRAV